ncbi:MAG: acyl-CoA/acyl-ACP dehydrogenase [Pseudomonadales bacterium]|nr:acyl-CoA/acyl-ACP dehydrogenase [Pseudomonadales bacterium]
MDTLLNEDEQLLTDQARAFLAKESSTALVREVEAANKDFDQGLWQKVAALGWLGMTLPEAYGGVPAPFSHLGLLFEELGRGIAPIPIHPTMVAALAIHANGSAQQAEAILPAVIKGDKILSWAYFEAGGDIDLSSINMSAAVGANSIVLSGKKLFVDGFKHADQCLVVCRSQPQSSGAEGISLVLVDTDSQGLSNTRLPTMAGDIQDELHFDKVEVPLDNVIGELHQAGAAAIVMFEQAVILNCAMMVGASHKAIEMTFDYAKEREAFGQPIGSFQAIQHMCANMVTWVDGATMLTHEALWKLAEGLPATREISVAKAFCNERCPAALREGNQIHAGIAQIKEYDLQLWYRRAAAWSMRMGTSIQHRRIVAREIGIVPEPSA